MIMAVARKDVRYPSGSYEARKFAVESAEPTRDRHAALSQWNRFAGQNDTYTYQRCPISSI